MEAIIKQTASTFRIQNTKCVSLPPSTCTYSGCSKHGAKGFKISDPQRQLGLKRANLFTDFTITDDCKVLAGASALHAHAKELGS